LRYDPSFDITFDIIIGYLSGINEKMREREREYAFDEKNRRRAMESASFDNDSGLAASIFDALFFKEAKLALKVSRKNSSVTISRFEYSLKNK